MSDDRQKTALVVGASGGIGSAVVVALVEAGFEVSGVGRKRPEDADLADFCQVDLGDRVASQSALAELAKEWRSPHLVVLNAGRGCFGSLEELSVEEITTTVEVNLIGHMLVARAFLPTMKRQRVGQLIFIGSESSMQGGARGSVYCATKFALRGFAQSLRLECAKSGIAVSMIHPGLTRTSFFDELDFEPEAGVDYAVDPEEVARAVVFAATSPNVVEELVVRPLKNVVRRKRRSP